MNLALAATTEVLLYPTSAAGSWSRLLLNAVQALAILGGLAAVAWLLFVFFGSRSPQHGQTWRRTMRFRMALGLFAFAGIQLWMPLSMALLTLSRLHAVWGALLALVPLVALCVMAHDFIWLARFWRAVDPTRCSACEHPLLDRQTVCPECGAPRAMASGGVQSRVHARFVIALLCVMGGGYGLMALGAAPLRWSANLLVELEDDDGQGIATIAASGTALTNVVGLNSGEVYGAHGIVREVHDAAAAPVDTTGARVFFVPILPPEGRVADETWFAALPTALASFPPQSAVASESWARTVRLRCAGREADFAPTIAKVETLVDFLRPPAWAVIAAMMSGPLTALVVFGAWRLTMLHIGRAVNRPTIGAPG
jgi:hypothetical protein